MERSTLLVGGRRNEQQPERHRREAVKALGALAVAEQDILTPLLVQTVPAHPTRTGASASRTFRSTKTVLHHKPPQPTAVLAPLCSSSLAQYRRATRARQRAPPQAVQSFTDTDQCCSGSIRANERSEGPGSERDSLLRAESFERRGAPFVMTRELRSLEPRGAAFFAHVFARVCAGGAPEAEKGGTPGLGFEHVRDGPGVRSHSVRPVRGCDSRAQIPATALRRSRKPRTRYAVLDGVFAAEDARTGI